MRKGKVILDASLLLEWLQFSGGDISGVDYDYTTHSVGLLIEHPEMPEIDIGAKAPIVNPCYTVTENRFGKIVQRQPL